MNDLPQPTDDELLLAYVDNCPNQAMSDYRRRLILDRAIETSYIRERFEAAWKERMFDMR